MIKYKKLNKKNLKNEIVFLSKLHLKFIKGNVTILGEQFIKSIYHHNLINLNAAIYLLIDEKNCIKSFLLVNFCKNFFLTKFFLKNFKLLVFTFTKCIFSLKKFEALVSLLKELNTRIIYSEEKEAELVTIVIDDSLKRKGFGAYLISLACKSLKKKDLNIFMLGSVKIIKRQLIFMKKIIFC